MSTYLEICQEVATESGTIPNIGDPTTTVGQTGALYRIVGWVRDAYKEIQRHKKDWRWLRTEFSGNTIASIREYNASAMGISERFSRWLDTSDEISHAFTIYKTSDGQATETFLRFLDYDSFRLLYGKGVNATTTGRPGVISVDDQNRLVFYPTPDAVYTVRGRYMKAPQVLSLDADVPEMPEEFHDAIKWRALMFLGNFDEAMEQTPTWAQNYFDLIADLEGNQIPQITRGDPLV